MTACSNPDKLAFTTQAEAMHNALRSSKKFGCPFRWYHCPAGHWHLASVKNSAIKTLRGIPDA